MNAAAPFHLREYLMVLRVRKRTILAAAAITLVSALAVSLRQTPIYASEAEVLVKPINASQTLLQNAPTTNLLNLDTEKELVLSTAVAEIARKAIIKQSPSSASDPRDLLKHLSVSVPSNTEILDITYSSPSPLGAQTGAEAFAEAYLTFKRTEALATFTSVQGGINNQITGLEKQLQNARYALSHSKAGSSRHLQAQNHVGLLNSQIALLRSQAANLSAIDIDPGAIVQKAEVPTSPASPNHLKNAALGLLVGLGLGVGIAFLRERLDDRLRGREDLEENLGAPVLVVIPKVPEWREREATNLAAIEEPRGHASEAYRTLRTSVLFMSAQANVKTLLVVSAVAGEGKSTTAANLATVLAQAGKRVILVSADLRKPRIHRFFTRGFTHLDNDHGLVQVVAGEMTLQEALQPSGVDGLWLLASGPIPNRPAEIAQSPRMAELLRALREAADFTIVDSAPALVVTDALAMAPLVDGVLYVADSEVTTGATVARARDQIEQVGGRIMGAVLNNYDSSRSRSYYAYQYQYRYSYAYGSGSHEDADQVPGKEQKRQGRSPI